eukprot:14093417-Alexandrium_andersonii.AAC.1
MAMDALMGGDVGHIPKPWPQTSCDVMRYVCAAMRETFPSRAHCGDAMDVRCTAGKRSQAVHT